jgi:hypothetical protein
VGHRKLESEYTKATLNYEVPNPSDEPSPKPLIITVLVVVIVGSVLAIGCALWWISLSE